MLRIVFVVFGIGVLTFSLLRGDAAAQSNCDEYTGAAGGLCNAYCEAMDCDGDPWAAERACDRVAEHFADVTGGDELPCEIPVVECPCESFYDIDTIMAGCAATYCGFVGEDLVAECDSGELRNFSSMTAPYADYCAHNVGAEIVESIPGLKREEIQACQALILDSEIWFTYCE